MNQTAYDLIGPIGKLSIEQLHHFNCCACKRWWSIGDANMIVPADKQEWYCPWCGHKQKVEAKDPTKRHF
jgi:hypothetical protein